MACGGAGKRISSQVIGNKTFTVYMKHRYRSVGCDKQERVKREKLSPNARLD